MTVSKRKKPIPIKDDHPLHNESFLGEGDFTCVKQMIYEAALKT